jgi:hypothetical protein
MCRIIELVRVRCAIQDLIVKLESSVLAALVEGIYE